jgi:hypothetical protein
VNLLALDTVVDLKTPPGCLFWRGKSFLSFLKMDFEMRVNIIVESITLHLLSLLAYQICHVQD